MKSSLVSICCLFIFNSAFSSATKVEAEPQLTHIQSWKELAPFAGRIIAFQTKSVHIGCDKGFMINPPTKFGYIKSKPKESQASFNRFFSSKKDAESAKREYVGYYMQRLINNDEVDSGCVLDDQEITKDQPFIVRNITFQEKTKIIESMNAKKAHFEYSFLFGEEDKKSFKASLGN